MQSVAPAISEETLLRAAAKLPASPGILAEFNEFTLDPHMVIDEATALLRRDSTLAASVVRVSNSPVYGGDRISAVEDAVARVGLREVYRMVSLATTARLAEMAMPTYGVFAGRLAKTTLLHGVAAEVIAGECGLDRRVAYTSALVRSIGMRIIDWVTRECDWIAPASATDLLGWERATLGFTNPQVAELVLRDWRFGEDVLDAVRGQYLEGGLRETPLMGIVLNVAGALGVRGEAAIAGEIPYWELTEEKLAALELSRDKFDGLVQSGRPRVFKIIRGFFVDCSTCPLEPGRQRGPRCRVHKQGDHEKRAGQSPDGGEDEAEHGTETGAQ